MQNRQSFADINRFSPQQEKLTLTITIDKLFRLAIFETYDTDFALSKVFKTVIKLRYFIK